MSDDERSGGDTGLTRHLSDEQFNAFLDDQLTSDERSLVTEHLVTCLDCQNTLDQLLVMTTVLGELPLAPVPRSFQLPGDPASSRGSLIDRIAALLVPALPAMRTATLVLVLALGGVTLARVLQDENTSQSDSAMITEQTSVATTVVATIEAAQPTVAEVTDGGAATEPDPDAAPTTEADGYTDSSEASDQSAPAAGAEDEQRDADGESAADDGADADLAMESAPMAAESAEESTETSSVGDTSMMKVPESQEATPGASPSPAEASPSPVASPERANTANASDPETEGDDERPWGAIQVTLLALIGMLVAGIAIARRRIPVSRV